MSKSIISLAALILVAFFASIFPCYAEMAVIVDTDMGNDDWIAIAYLLNDESIDVKAITTSGNGLSSCPAAAMNARYLVQLAGRNSIPISCGSDWPLDGYNSYPIIWRAKANSMMDLRPVEPPSAQAEIDSVQLMVNTLIDSQMPITILSIGAMTNIASALKAEPRIKNKIKRIVAMAGAINVAGNLQVHGFTDEISNKLAEWNVWIDPLAAKIVFKSGVPITLVPLDTTNKLHLQPSFIQKISAFNRGPVQQFVARVFSKMIAQKSTGEYFHWDPAAAVVMNNPHLCHVIHRRFDVVVDRGFRGKYFGQAEYSFPRLRWDSAPRNFLDEHRAGALVPTKKILQGVHSTNNVDICTDVRLDSFESIYLSVFN